MERVETLADLLQVVIQVEGVPGRPRLTGKESHGIRSGDLEIPVPLKILHSFVAGKKGDVGLWVETAGDLFLFVGWRHGGTVCVALVDGTKIPVGMSDAWQKAKSVGGMLKKLKPALIDVFMRGEDETESKK